MRRRLAKVALLGATALPLLAAGPYQWPLREPPALTSTYGEYRPSHFHGGIDLTTGGVTGVPVVAVADGYIERVRASGAGYGRAIYVHLADGRTAVYAHLSQYAPAIRAYVEAAQDSLVCYEVDLYPPAGLLPVRRGDVLGASGESGAGSPHFHFEMRRGEIGLNPLVHGFPVADTIPPTLVSIELLPLDAGARVGGSLERTTVWPTPARRAATQDTVPVRGRLGLLVRAHDHAPGRPNLLAVFSAQVLLDGGAFYSCRLDSASWLRTHEVEVAYDATSVRGGWTDVLRLWRPPGAESHVFGADGVLDFDPIGAGLHRIEIVVADAAGNKASGAFEVEAEGTADREDLEDEIPASAAVSVAEGEEGAAGESLAVAITFHGRYLEARVDSAASLAAPPVFALEGPAAVRRLEAGPDDAGFRSFFTPAADEVGRMRLTASAVTVSGAHLFATKALPVIGVPRGRSGRAEFAGGSLTYDPDSFFGDALVSIETLVPEVPGQGLAMVGAQTRFTSADEVLDGGVVLAFALPAERAPQVGLFRRAGGVWFFAGSAYDTERGVVSARVRRLGTYALLRDSEPPIVYNVAPATQSRVDPRARLAAHVKDAGSGVTASILSILLDGRRVVAEYDPEAGTLTAHLRHPLAEGAHEVRFEASDRLGNQTEKTARFTVAVFRDERRR